MTNTKDKINVNVALPSHTYELFRATMRLNNQRPSVLLRKIIGCAISDYYGGDREHDFSKITPEMRDCKRPYRVSSTINKSEYETLQAMLQELGIEAIPQLLRRFCDFLLADYFAECSGLPVVKMPEQIKVDVVIE